ncbi:hypothetical protein LSAT2_014586 [Lamellibrachia satsuma]|nr:hypothetical protein LSAT2_014586 [Lamellibrachia satsuma]
MEHVILSRAELQNAVDERDLNPLLAAIEEVEDLGFDNILQQEMIIARCLAEQLQRLMRLKLAILNMDKNTMSEIRRYDRPKPILHEVLQAVFLLLGEDEETMSDWKKCRAFCNPNGKEGLQRKIMKFDIKTVHPELMARCKEVLDKYTVTEVQTVSAGAGTFYVWCLLLASAATDDDENQRPQTRAM